MKVGEYIRTKKGIAKYLGLGRDILKHETSKDTYEHYYSQHLFDNYIFNVGHDYGDTLTDDEFNNIDKLGKVKEKIIDLINVGDYVNKIQITSIENDNKGKYVFGYGADGMEGEMWFYNDDIKSIVTKEQFESMEYKL